jgi:hypothetical protein
MELSALRIEAEREGAWQIDPAVFENSSLSSPLAAYNAAGVRRSGRRLRSKARILRGNASIRKTVPSRRGALVPPRWRALDPKQKEQVAAAR